MSKVYKIGEYYLAGVEHVIPGYFQDVVFVYKNNNNWISVSAERFRANNPDIEKVKEAVKYATHEDDLKQAIENLKKMGIKIEEIQNIPFPRKLIEGKRKIQEEID
ncbi:hypothetical protein BFU36_01100 [Sulfolobus sp. A20]|uniref:hypothetical protein n=1 Tax=Sulfolobaceae TaxID=118883 RepID=UPI00084624F7|nr:MULTISPECIES: hypothetical protein [unclassified Sulfolobus]TRM76180.1 hypothetical protein DJ523_01620 [Sulfolobus sp. E5]TRM77023.1 hypothetical protein DJ532_05990 [Sulfolobus sp. A20-N-F8]TRM79237.1 hypothetical protein DJ528_02220 [Sulfolobus sp. B5]TRM81529.1 hypothetical protein DJ524_03735 [Sulfolobus sp. D5]TRM83768.1 hypothetical protein DJ531_04040 [Sulfolobus sp. A20-N-F6]TRM86875.1 hypothetical protein DJ521_04705 [Sulfolobus sp. E3]TRM88936.1 hypothetical protein DJ529_03850